MKWKHIFLFYLLSQTVNPQIFIEDGFGGNCVICRNPFCGGISGCDIGSITITSPISGTDYYFPNHNLDINYTLTGFNSPSCRYRIDANDWNTLTCANGENWELGITMPEGYPVRVTIEASDNCQTVTEYVEFNVHYRQGFGGIINKNLILPYVFGFLLLVWLVGETWRRRKRRYMYGI